MGTYRERGAERAHLTPVLGPCKQPFTSTSELSRQSLLIIFSFSNWSRELGPSSEPIVGRSPCTRAASLATDNRWRRWLQRNFGGEVRENNSVKMNQPCAVSRKPQCYVHQAHGPCANVYSQVIRRQLMLGEADAAVRLYPRDAPFGLTQVDTGETLSHFSRRRRIKVGVILNLRASKWSRSRSSPPFQILEKFVSQ